MMMVSCFKVEHNLHNVKSVMLEVSLVINHYQILIQLMVIGTLALLVVNQHFS
jgi:hypothetical protein